MIVMNLLKIENICYSETFFMRKNTFFIHFIIVILIFKALITILLYSLQKKETVIKRPLFTNKKLLPIFIHTK